MSISGSVFLFAIGRNSMFCLTSIRYDLFVILWKSSIDRSNICTVSDINNAPLGNPLFLLLCKLWIACCHISQETLFKLCYIDVSTMLVRLKLVQLLRFLNHQPQIKSHKLCRPMDSIKATHVLIAGNTEWAISINRSLRRVTII